jgi:heme-degrading monooxygenase HmoA
LPHIEAEHRHASAHGLRAHGLVAAAHELLAACVTALDGEAPKRAVVQVWDSMEKIQAWRSNPEYKELRKVGDKYAKFRSYTVEGLPQ